VDALSHALIAYILFSIPPLPPLLPFVIVGAVLPDIDIFLSPVSDTSPPLYLFTHGGIAHSLAGAFVLSLIAFGTAGLLSAAGVIPAVVLSGTGTVGFLAVLAGALLHLAIDLPACPGIPLFAPFADRKYTLAVLPGPSLLLAGAATGVAIASGLRLLPFPSALWFYGNVVVAYLAVRTVFFLYAGARLPGRKIPAVSPIRWLVILEDETAYIIRQYSLFHGYSGESVFGKYRGTNAREIAGLAGLTEVRRLVFHSYCVTAERIGSVIVLADPVRENGYLWYPPKYRRVAVPAGHQP
jgi:inner membrane protein